MADQGLWFKLWCSVLDDPDLDNLALPDFARWAKLGALIKRQGTAGKLHLSPPARALCAMFQVPDYKELLHCFIHLPNVVVDEVPDVVVSGETSHTVTFRNWAKYQGDYSTPRVRELREVKRLRREEMRREEMRGDVGVPPLPPTGGFDRFWSEYPKKVGKGAARAAWSKVKAEPLTDQIITALHAQNGYLEREGGKFIPLPATWLNQHRWEDEPPTDFMHTATKARIEGAAEWLRVQKLEETHDP